MIVDIYDPITFNKSILQWIALLEHYFIRLKADYFIMFLILDLVFYPCQQHKQWSLLFAFIVEMSSQNSYIYNHKTMYPCIKFGNFILFTISVSLQMYFAFQLWTQCVTQPFQHVFYLLIFIHSCCSMIATMIGSVLFSCCFMEETTEYYLGCRRMMENIHKFQVDPELARSLHYVN